MLSRRTRLFLLKSLSLFSIVRGYNVLVIVLAQYLAAIFIMAPDMPLREVVLDINLFVLVVSSALVIAGGAYFIIRWRLTRYVLILTTIVVTIMVGLLAYNNRYLELAPNYERTVTHRNFENLLEATYQGEDISTMERVYRWVAGFYMSKERPVFGFGPGNFFPYYKSFTVKSFQTYVSDNIEQSGIHSYYLMVLVEQGYPGLFFFVLFTFFTLLKGENIYHYLKKPKDKQVVMTCLLSTIIILSLLIINDLIETDKIGSFFFINLAILVNIDLGDQTAAHDR